MASADPGLLEDELLDELDEDELLDELEDELEDELLDELDEDDELSLELEEDDGLSLELEEDDGDDEDDEVLWLPPNGLRAGVPMEISLPYSRNTGTTPAATSVTSRRPCRSSR